MKMLVCTLPGLLSCRQLYILYFVLNIPYLILFMFYLFYFNYFIVIIDSNYQMLKKRPSSLQYKILLFKNLVIQKVTYNLQNFEDNSMKIFCF
jgi:hypothetical protein